MGGEGGGRRVPSSVQLSVNFSYLPPAILSEDSNFRICYGALY